MRVCLCTVKCPDTLARASSRVRVTPAPPPPAVGAPLLSRLPPAGADLTAAPFVAPRFHSASHSPLSDARFFTRCQENVTCGKVHGDDWGLLGSSAAFNKEAAACKILETEMDLWREEMIEGFLQLHQNS